MPHIGQPTPWKIEPSEPRALKELRLAEPVLVFENRGDGAAGESQVMAAEVEQVAVGPHNSREQWVSRSRLAAAEEGGDRRCRILRTTY